jgi:hypothetical protein
MSSVLKVDEIQNTDGKTGLVITPDGSIDGIKFPEEANPSGRTITSTTMSSFEEGLFTPVLEGSVSNPTYSGSKGGRYTKIASTVHFSAFVDVNPYTTDGSGELYFAGLPFTIDDDSGSGAGTRPVINVSIWGSTIGSGKHIAAQAVNSSKHLRFSIWGDNSAQTLWTYATALMSSGDAIYVQGHYYTTE